MVALVWGGAPGWGRLGAEPLPQDPGCWARSLPAVRRLGNVCASFEVCVVRQPLLIRGRSCVEEHSSPLDNPRVSSRETHFTIGR